MKTSRHAKHGWQVERKQSAWRDERRTDRSPRRGSPPRARPDHARADRFAFFASLAFGSTAIVSGRINLLLYVPLAGLLMAGAVLRRTFWRDLERVFRLHWTPIVVVTLLVYGVASAFILPRLFAGATTVFVPSARRHRRDRAPASVRQHQPVGLLRIRHPRVLRGGEPAGAQTGASSCCGSASSPSPPQTPPSA